MLEALRRTGLIRGYGASVDSAQDMMLVLEHSQATHIEVLFNIFFRDARKAFESTFKKGVKIIVNVPLDSGWLTGNMMKRTRLMASDQDDLRMKSKREAPLSNMLWVSYGAILKCHILF